MWQITVKSRRKIGVEVVETRRVVPALSNIPKPVLAARLRAVRGFSGDQQKKLADALGVSVTTLSRWERAEIRVPDAQAIKAAELCNVPISFLERGFDIPAESDDPSQSERIEALEKQMRTVLRAMAARGVLEDRKSVV